MIELSNGCQLDKELREIETNYWMTMAAAARVFRGKAKIVTVHCTATDHENCWNQKYGVIRSEDGTVAVGCVKFTPNDVKVIRKWINRKGK
jgi:hypothetical protein